MPFKKIFKPIAKVLDKVIPNEIKPALPYLAAFAPVFGPTAGMFGNTMMKRALLSGGANILGQLSQEGSEGDINLLSAGLGALTGAMTTPGAAETFRGATAEKQLTLDQIKKGTLGLSDATAQQAAITEGLKNQGILSQAKDFGLETLAKGSEILRPDGAIPNLFSKQGLKAATIPAATATGDVMQAQARQLEKQAAIDAALAEAEALADSGLRGDAIRNAMRAYGFFTDEEIEDTVSSAGYRTGGRVGFNVGGPTSGQGLSALLGSEMIGRAGEGMEDAENKPFKFDSTQFMIDQYNESGIQPEIIGEGFDGQSFVIRTPMGGSMIISLGDFIDNFGEPPMKAKGIERDADDQPYRYKTGGRAGYRFGGIDEAIEMVEEKTVEEGKKGIMQASGEDPMLIEEYNKYVFDLLEQRPNAKPMSFKDFKRMIKAGMKMGGRVKAEEGGLMDLGGKEMDLRGGGFVPIGKKEKADDVPARLSKNEFVMTADAVRAAGGGSVNEGAKRMYKVMNDLEARA